MLYRDVLVKEDLQLHNFASKTLWVVLVWKQKQCACRNMNAFIHIHLRVQEKLQADFLKDVNKIFLYQSSKNLCYRNVSHRFGFSSSFFLCICYREPFSQINYNREVEVLVAEDFSAADVLWTNVSELCQHTNWMS